VRVLASHREGALRRGRVLVFWDEVGFSQRPSVRRTWVPKGRTPVRKEPCHWKRLGAIWHHCPRPPHPPGVPAVLPATRERGQRLGWGSAALSPETGAGAGSVAGGMGWVLTTADRPGKSWPTSGHGCRWSPCPLTILSSTRWN
jgi:hypothetical protein